MQDNGTGANRKYVRLDPTTGTLFANNAQITGSLVITGGATKTAIDSAQADATQAKADAAAASGAASSAASAATAASAAAASKAKVFRDSSYSSSNKPTPSAIGDIWIDVNDYNKMYVASTTSSTGWVLSQDSNSKLDSSTFSKSEIIKKINDNNNGAGIEGSVIFGSAIISNNVLAGERGIRGDTFTQYGSIFDLDNGTISTPNFKINSAGNAEFKGSIKSGSSIEGATITGGTVSTSSGDQYMGWLRLNGPTNSLDFLSTSNSISGKMYSFGGGEIIIQYGGDQYLGYPKSTGFISLNSTGIRLGRSNATGTVIGGIFVDNTNAEFSGVNVYTSQGAPIGDDQFYMRNIGMGTGPKSTSDTSGYRGDIWIQYS